MSKDTRTGLALGFFFLLLGIGIGLAAAQWWRPQADWLGFAGATIGAGATVLGAFFVIDYQADGRVREERAMLLDLLGDVSRAAESFYEEADIRRPKPSSAQISAGFALSHAVDAVKSARGYLTPNSAKMIRIFTLIDRLEFDLNPSFEKGPPGTLRAALTERDAKTAIALLVAR